MTAPQGPWDPQHGPDPRDDPACPERHLDAGAYVLGLLDASDLARFEEHLAHCPRCAEEVASLGRLEPLLAEFKADSAALVGAGAGAGRGENAGRGDRGESGGLVGASLAGPGPRLLDGLLAEAAATRRRTRVRRRWLVAVAAVLVVGGPAATAAVLDGGGTGGAPVAAAAAHSASAPDGASASVAVTPTSWGSSVTLRLAGVAGPRSCDLVAVSTQGARQTVASWTVPAGGYGSAPAARLTTSGGTGFQPGEISHFEVRDLLSDQLLLSIPAH
ncbi:zf-HC2 domain-containing protein [Kitasatospora sp. NBC_01287]|uniref:zf-HC2 domain-containing protein n=1 Tax=Kitasatospora sp. NBC_01287 TaxID=2903573 RepID=UPI002259BDE4|nr:zf-HC2 domain-containing protein [Kitasatospora sp. NBC_01287]MCX4749892.1 zf-HC2 domain-containing protein [Kitasatospora sp. NBC_01287]